MAAMDRVDKYSRMVLWLKVGLPLVALGILSTLFFVAETLDPEAAIPYAEIDVERILREQGMTRPTFGGVTSQGVEISLSAASVRPGQDQRSRLTGETLVADLTIPDRGEILIRSPEGVIDAESGLAILRGGAFLESSTGYRVETEEIVTSYAEATLQADQEVRATGPAGTLTAGSLELRQQQGETAVYLLVFKNGVRLIYEPKP
mgnify:CR=1 FL=1